MAIKRPASLRFAAPNTWSKLTVARFPYRKCGAVHKKYRPRLFHNCFEINECACLLDVSAYKKNILGDLHSRPRWRELIVSFPAKRLNANVLYSLHDLLAQHLLITVQQQNRHG